VTVQDRIRLESKDLLPYLGENHMLMVLREDRTRGKVKEVMGKILMWIPYDADYEQRGGVVIHGDGGYIRAFAPAWPICGKHSLFSRFVCCLPDDPAASPDAIC